MLTVNLTCARAALDPVAGDVVAGFHVLFAEDAPQTRAAAEEGEAGQLLARLAELAGHQDFAEALRLVNGVLAKNPALCSHDTRFAWLRGALLAGIAGQPKSVAVLDLAAAERAFVEISAQAGRDRSGAAALVAAGKCAYADGRFRQAGTHRRAALKQDPGAAEAHYQLARLRRHAGDMRAVRKNLVLSFGIGYGYALRAASDPLFGADAGLLRRCVKTAVRRATAATRDTLAGGLARLRFLVRHADPDFPAASLARFASTRDAIVSLAAEPSPATLRKALRGRTTARATCAPVTRLAEDYCALLRRNEETIVRRDAEWQAARDPSQVARWLTRGMEASVVGMLIAVIAGTFDFAAAAPFPGWHANASALGLALAVLILWLLMHTSFLRRPTRQFFECVVTALQARARARFECGGPARIVRNRRRLHRRIRRIERRFGIAGS